MIPGVGVLRLVNDEDVRRAEADAERAAAVQAAAISRALDERGAPAPAGGRLLPEAKAVRASTASDRLTRRVEELRLKAARAARETPDEAPEQDAEAPDTDAPEQDTPDPGAPARD